MLGIVGVQQKKVGKNANLVIEEEKKDTLLLVHNK